MKKLALIFSLIALLAVPATAAAEKGGAREDVKRCKALRSQDGGQGEARGIGKCVSKNRRHNRQLKRQAARECKAELVANVQEFEDKYAPAATQAGRPEGLDAPDAAAPGGGSEGESEGDDDGHRLIKAFRNCVKLKVKAAKRAHKDAVETCREERSDDVRAFRARYGASASSRNAFGRCVSKHVREDDDEGDDRKRGGEEGGGKEDEGGKAEQGDDAEQGGEDAPGDEPQED